MKAILNTQYGSPDVLQFVEIPKPTPKDNEVLINVHAVSIKLSRYSFIAGRSVHGPL